MRPDGDLTIDAMPAPAVSRTLAGERSPDVHTAHAPDAAADEAVVGKIYRRLIGFLFVLFVFSFLDRINIGFAGLTMGRDLGLSATAFGLASTVFYGAYILFGIPSNIMLGKLGARRWIATIMVAWGLASTATMFAWDANSLYVLRILVGITEAGFLPGVLLYMTFWFPAAHRARANAFFMIAMPVTSALGAIVSGYMLKLDGLHGLHGWQWLFMLEGLPSALLGIAVWLYLDDTPEKAKWLTPDERMRLAAMMEKDVASSPVQKAGGQEVSLTKALFSLPVMKLALAYFLLVNTLGMISTWVPQIVKSFNEGSSDLAIGMLTAVPHVVTIAAMVVWGRRSDKHQERRWHVALPMLFAAAGWALTSFAADPVVKLAGLCAASAGAYASMTIFWTLPDLVMSANHRAIGIAFINAAGIVGAALNAVIVGYLRDVTSSFTSGLLYAAAVLVLGALVVITFARGGAAEKHHA